MTTLWLDNSRDKADAIIETLRDKDLQRAAEASVMPVDNLSRQVYVFHKLYNMAIVRPDQAQRDFGHITKERLAMRFGLIAEEFLELCEAMDIRADINFHYQDEDGKWQEAESHLGTAVRGPDMLPDPRQVTICYDEHKKLSMYQLNHDYISGEEMHVIMRERLQHAIMETDERDMVDVADACGDLKYVIAGFELEVGIPGPQVLAEIQCSNLSKLGEDGLPIYRSDGKVLKGPNYFKADIQGVLRAQGLKIGAGESWRV